MMMNDGGGWRRLRAIHGRKGATMGADLTPIYAPDTEVEALLFLPLLHHGLGLIDFGSGFGLVYAVVTKIRRF